MDPPEAGTDSEAIKAVTPGSPRGPHKTAENEQPDVVTLAERLFQASIDHPNDIKNTSATAYTYPEAILQQTENANRYYFQFQSFQRQFIQEDQDSLNKSVRWSQKSKIQQTLKSIIEDWLITEQKGRTIQTENDLKKVLPANALFSWSSGDSYIQERRRQLEERKRKSKLAVGSDTGANTGSVTSTNIKPTEEKLPLNGKKAPKTTPVGESIASRLNRTIETESNKFIHARIQKIKAHHNEQISKKIHERKRKDHENHLMRLKLKEEEYERSLQITSNLKQAGGFFGTIFGFNTQNDSKKDMAVAQDLNSGSSITEKVSSRPSTPLDLAFNTSVPMSALSSTSTTATPPTSSKATETNKPTSSSSKSKRFSFLPKASKRTSDTKPKKESDQYPLDHLDDTVFDQQIEHEQHQAKISALKLKSGSPPGGVLTPTVLTPTVLTPTVLTPTVLTPTRREFSIESTTRTKTALNPADNFSSPKQNHGDEGLTGSGRDDDDDDDDFLDFTSSVPLPVPQIVNQAPPVNTNRFMAVHTSNINKDLLDLFGNEQSSQQPQKKQDGNAPVEDLLSI